MKVEDDDDESISIDVEWKAMTSPVTERSLVESRMAADGWLPALRAAGSALAHFNAGALPSQHIPQLEVSIINEESRDEDNYVVYCISVRAVGRRPSIGGSVDEDPVAPLLFPEENAWVVRKRYSECRLLYKGLKAKRKGSKPKRRWSSMGAAHEAAAPETSRGSVSRRSSDDSLNLSSSHAPFAGSDTATNRVAEERLREISPTATTRRQMTRSPGARSSILLFLGRRSWLEGKGAAIS